MDCEFENGPTMSLVRITAPALPVVSLERMRQHLNVDATFGTSPPSHPDDELIMEKVQAATEELEGVTGWLGRVLVSQQWRLTMPRFPGRIIRLPFAPLIGVDSITYLDADGARQTLTDVDGSPAGEDYRVVTAATPGYVTLPHGGAWPSGRAATDAVQINFTAGYGDPDDVPALVRQWIMTRAGDFYEQRENIVLGLNVSEIPSYKHSLENFRVRGVITP